MEAHTQYLESDAHQPGSPPEPVPETSDLRIVFRGYDMAQVDDLVASLVDDREHFYMADPGDAATRAGIERITSKTKTILMAAQQSAQELRNEAASEAAEVKSEADAYASKVRSAADSESAQVMREAHAERLRIEAMIEDLREHRDVIVENLNRLRGNLSEVVEESHQGTYEWASAEEDDEDEDLDLDLGDFDEDEGGAEDV